MDGFGPPNVDNHSNLVSGSITRLENLSSQSGNKYCADCGSPDPKWVYVSIRNCNQAFRFLCSSQLFLFMLINRWIGVRSTTLGVFICIKCSGAHRSLGVHVSKVLSMKLDEWTDEQVDELEDMGGNTAINGRYEAFLPENVKKPNPESCIEERFDFIRHKYVFRQFSNCNSQTSPDPHSPPLFYLSSPKKDSPSSHEKRQSEKQQLGCRFHGFHGLGHAFRNSLRKREDHKATRKKSTIGMVEYVGLIKVNVIRGTNLAVRDILSSDPYVILTLGQQSLKTSVIKKNLNPVWNEKIMLSIPDPIPPLKLEVYDKDTFTPDDRMGDAEIDIQPLVAAAKAYEDSSVTESMELGKWLASEDNTLVKDSVIHLADGEVKQEITLRLQNVERGELEIELECVPLSQ